MADLQEGQGADDVILEGTEGAGAGEGGELKKATSEFYTPEEIETVLAEGGTLDANKLSPEGKLLQKSFERGFTKKFEEMGELSRTLKEAIKPKDALDGWVENYINDPKGVTAFVHNQIRALEDQADPLEPNYKAIKGQIHALQADLDMVRERAREKETVASKTNAIPEEIREFAKTEGYTDKELLSPKILKAVTALHKTEQATQKLSHLAKKKEPSEVTKPGNGSHQSKSDRPLSDAEIFYGTKK